MIDLNDKFVLKKLKITFEMKAFKNFLKKLKIMTHKVGIMMSSKKIRKTTTMQNFKFISFSVFGKKRMGVHLPPLPPDRMILLQDARLNRVKEVIY